jgi:hypothetical protein
MKSKMSKKKEEFEVVVLSRDEITTYPKLNQPEVTVMVTYVGGGLPPFTIRIPKDKWTPEYEKTLIRASIEDRLKKKPETYRV